MALKKISSNVITGLKELEDEGGQGLIYIFPPDKLIKIYTDEDTLAITSKRLEIIGNNPEIFNNLKGFCAIPEIMVENSDTKQLIGFQMSHFKNFHSVGKLLDKSFCVKNKITIRKVVKIFLSIHDGISKIHANHMIIGDLNEDNILFKFNDRTVLLRFVDIDSWAVRHGNLNLPISATTMTFCHPDLETNPGKLEKYHDWYSFAILLARSLVKSNPFNMGDLDEKTMKSIQGDSQKNGITCWDRRVCLNNIDSIYVNRFGKSLTDTLEKWLSGKQTEIFPKETLEEFLDGLGFCKQCGFEVHMDHVKCTKCKSDLKPPTPNPYRKQLQQTNQGKNLTNLIASGG